MPQEMYLLYCMNKPHCFITTGKQFNNKVAKSKMTLAIPYCYRPQDRCKESPVQRKTSQRICLNIKYLNQLGQLLLEGSFLDSTSHFISIYLTLIQTSPWSANFNVASIVK